MHQKKLEELKGTLSLAVIDMMWYEFPYFRYDFFVLKEFHGQPYVDAKFPHLQYASRGSHSTYFLNPVEGGNHK